jgi:hypothetical protein
MITLNFEGICTNCNYAELEISSCETLIPNRGDMTCTSVISWGWEVRCKHEDACKRANYDAWRGEQHREEKE